MHTKNQISAETDLSRALGRIAMPCFLFSSVLLLALVISHAFLLPEFTKVEVAGTVRDAAALQAHKESLLASLERMEQKREELITPLQGTTYASMRDRKVARTPFLLLSSHIDRTVEGFTSGGQSVVSLDALNYAPSDSVITLRGIVYRVGPRSMTVLAKLTDALSDIPGVVDVTHPAFTRQKDENGEFYSPFVLSLHIQ